jgi:hypothetical protein
VDPVTKQVAYAPDGTTVASPAICIASYRTQNAAGGSEPTWNYNWPGTIGVAARSANPRAEFNVIVTGYGFDSEGHDYRASGNFFNVLPDGVTAADMSVLNGGLQEGDGYFECGRNNSNITFGTDGDGVNDADEGNVCGPWANGGAVCLDTYSANGLQTGMVIAGNYFNADINGHSLGDNLGGIVDSFKNSGTGRFGSDFNGVSDDLEGNLVINEPLFRFDSSWTTNGSWVSMRGNSMSNCTSASLGRPPLGDGQTTTDGLNTYSNFIDISGPNGTFDIIPVISNNTTTATLVGSCGKAVGAPYTKLVVDLYLADPDITHPPQGMKWLGAFVDNSTADANLAAAAFSFSTAGLGLSSGSKITITVTYVRDNRPTVSSISRSGNQTSLTVTGGSDPGATYGILKAATVNGSYALTAAAVNGSATFTDSGNPSFYKATPPSATGQTSPFSDVYTIP